MKKFFLIWGSLLFVLSGCNLPLAHGFADEALPEEPLVRAVSIPFIAPIYALLAAIDITLVNPITACVHLPEEIARAWNEDADDPNQAKIITVKILVSPLYTVYLLGFIIFSEQFQKEESQVYEVETPTESPKN